MNQKLSDWASIAEIIASVAVVVSLVYVGYEVSENTAQMRAANRQSTAARVQDFAIAAASNPDLALIALGNIGTESLTPVQQAQVLWYNVAFYRNSEEAYLQFLDGLLSEEYWNTRATVTVGRTRTTSGGAYWESDKSNFSPRFREWLDGELRSE